MMNNIAVVYKNNQPAFVDILKKENTNLKEININDITDDISSLNDYDIIFVNIDDDINKALELIGKINKIKILKNNKIVIATSIEPNDLNIQQAISSGANDFLRQNIDAETLLKRLEYYSAAVSRKKDEAIAYDVILDAQPYNIFTDNIFKRSIKFEINKEEKLISAWDYLIPYADSKSNLCGLRLFFSIAEWLVNNTDRYYIIYEEDDNNHYVTMQYYPIPKRIISKLAIKYCQHNHLRYDDEKISIILEKRQDFHSQIIQKKINAKEFMDATPLEVTAKLDMLEDLEDRLTLEINNLHTNKNKEILHTIADLFREYSNIIFLLNEFGKLSDAINGMANAIENMENETLNEDETVNLVVSLLYSLIDDLSKWRIKVFVNQEAKDIHYLDDSLLASCDQVNSILQKEDSSENDDEYGDIELF